MKIQYGCRREDSTLQNPTSSCLPIKAGDSSHLFSIPSPQHISFFSPLVLLHLAPSISFTLISTFSHPSTCNSSPSPLPFFSPPPPWFQSGLLPLNKWRIARSSTWTTRSTLPSRIVQSKLPTTWLTLSRTLSTTASISVVSTRTRISRVDSSQSAISAQSHFRFLLGYRFCLWM